MLKSICFTFAAFIVFNTSYAAQCKVNFTRHGNFEYHGHGSTEKEARENALNACYRDEVNFDYEADCLRGYMECSSTSNVYCTPSDYLHGECSSCNDDGPTSSRQCWMADSCGNFKYLVSTESPCRGS